MKKCLNFLVLAFVLLFVACGNNDTNSDNQTENIDSNSQVIKVGATPNPHARILENIKDDLASEGIELQIVEFSDYVLPNLSLDDGSIDANFYQHQPYLDKMKKDKNLKLDSIAKVHIEPLGFYSKVVKSINDIKNGAQIVIPNDPSNSGRALILLHNNGIIKLRDPSNLYSTELDIIENPKNIQIKQLEAAMLPKVFADVDGAVINGNYALQAGLNSKDAVFLEDSRSPYANVLVVRSIDIDNPKLLKLKEKLLSAKTKKFIDDQYKGEIISVF